MSKKKKGPTGKSESKFSVPFELEAGVAAREYDVRLVKSGFVQGRDGDPVNWYVPADTIKAAVEAGSFENISCFIDHADYFDSPSVKGLCGIFHNAVYVEEDQSAYATLRLYDREDLAWVGSLFDQIIANSKEGLSAALGFSLLFYGDHEWQEGSNGETRVTTDFGFVESCDVVFRPGADGRLKEALSAAGVILPENINGAMSPNIINTLGGVPMDDNTIQTPANGAGQTPTEDTDVLATPKPAQVQDVDVLAQIAGMRQEIAGLTAALATRIEPGVIQGMGQPPCEGSPGRIHGMQTPLDRFTAVDWIFGVEGAEMPDPQFRRMDAVYRALTGDYELRGVFDKERVMLAAATTGTLAGMAVNAMNKVIMVQFSALAFWRWFEQIVTPTPNDGTLNAMQWITYGGISNLPTVPEGGAYGELSVDDAKESDSFIKKGGYVGITREMIKNSDILRIQAVPKALAVAALRTRSAAVSAIFTQASGVGPTLDQDSTPLFHADHGNVATTAFGTSTAAWRAARIECFKHAEINSGKRLGIFPRFALVPADLYDVALTVFGYGEGMPTAYVPEAESRGSEDPRPIPLAVPDWTDAGDWAYITDPIVNPVIGISYSQAPGGGQHPAPELFAVTAETGGLMFTNDTLPIKVRDEFAVGVNGPRGIGKRNVA